jgi:DNA-binding MarR family transcriptional regulator
MTVMTANPDDPPLQLGALTAAIGPALRRAETAAYQDIHRALGNDGIRAAQFAVLEVLARNPGRRQTEVSAALGLKTTNFVPLLDELERRGLAERRPIAGDRRAKGLFLTALGHALQSRLSAQLAAHEVRLAARLGPEGKAQLFGLLSRLADPAFDPRP